MKHTSKMFRALFSAGRIQFILGFAAVVFTGQALAQGDTWDTTKASRVTATTASSAGVIDGILYVVGGTPSGVIDMVEAYDPVSDTWTTKPPIPTPRGFAASGVINGKLYVVGGGNPFDISRVDIYDPVTNSWSTASNPMLDPRSSVSAGVIDGILYVVGGDVFGQNASVNTLRAYNPVTDTWVLKASMPTGPRQHLAVGVIDGKLYAVGGFSTCCASLDTLEVYNPLTNSWTTAAPLPVGKNQLVAGVIDGKLYAVGGIPTTGGATDDTFEYDPTTNTWASRTPIPTARFAASAGVIDGKLYVVGGFNEVSALTILEVYTPPTTNPAEFYQVETTLDKGVNMISLPLRPKAPISASQLATDLEATWVIRAIDGHFQTYIPDGNFGIDFDIEVSKGYIVNLLEAKTYSVTGQPWGTPVSAAPTPLDRGIWAFVVAGRIDDFVPIEVYGTIQVTNLRTGEKHLTPISTSGRFTTAFVDMSRQTIIAVGDTISTQLISTSGVPLTEAKTHIITSTHINHALLTTTLSALPTQTQLLQNYPNPFNPETWIPFQLAGALSHVVIEIYDLNGRQIRRLDVGHRGSGWYLSRDRAAYWDGKNSAGEKVSSGVYFYQITANGYRATRRMVILK